MGDRAVSWYAWQQDFYLISKPFKSDSLKIFKYETWIYFHYTLNKDNILQPFLTPACRWRSYNKDFSVLNGHFGLIIENCSVNKLQLIKLPETFGDFFLLKDC